MYYKPRQKSPRTREWDYGRKLPKFKNKSSHHRRGGNFSLSKNLTLT